MPDRDPGPFISALGWMNDLGQVPMNVLRGRFKSAGKKAVDILGDIPDAVIPGDWIPHISENEDNTTGSEVLGIDDEKHPLFAGIADLGLGVATNPVSYLGVRGGKLKYGKPLTEGTEVPVVNDLVSSAKAKIGSAPDEATKIAKATTKDARRYLNLLDTPDESLAKMKQAQGAGAQSAAIHEERVQQIFGKMSERERDVAGQILHKIDKGKGAARKDWRQIDDVDEFLSRNPDVDANKIKAALGDTYEHGQKQWDEGLSGGLFRNVTGADGKIIPAKKDYFHARFTKDGSDVDIDALDLPQDGLVKSSALRKKTLKTPQDTINFLNDKPGVELDFDPLSVGLSRSSQQGRGITKGALGKAYTGNKDFSLSDPEHVTAMKKAIDDLGDTDEGYQLRNLWQGMPERSNNAFVQALHKGNKIFKGAATFGVVMPRLAFNVGNRVSGLWQAFSNDAARGTVGASSRRVLQDLLGAVDDGFVKLTGGKKRRWESSELTDDISHWESSAKAAKGDPVEFRKLILAHKDGKERGQMLLEALDNDVINAGWVDQEQLLTKLAATPMRQRLNDIMEWPASIAKGVEQRMRLGTFKDLRKQTGKDAVEPASAAKTVRDTYLDYAQPGVENRRFRDIVPFGAFLSQNVKQQGKFLARHPVVGVAASQMYGSDGDHIRYPWMDEQMSIPAGLDEQGNPQYISSLRLPIEGLSAVPGFGQEDLYHDLGSPLQPLLKTALSYATGKDTFTGGQFGSYDKVLGESQGAAGRTYNALKGTGLLQPLTGPVDQLTNLIDSRKSIGQRALQATTGVRFQSVDPDQAKKLEIEEYLKSNPEIRQRTSFYQTKGEEDPGLTELLAQLDAAKAALKLKREAASVTPR